MFASEQNQVQGSHTSILTVPPEYLTSERAGELLGYTPQHVTRLVRTGTLRGEKLGRDWVISRESVARFLAQRGTRRLPWSQPRAVGDGSS